MTIVCGAFFRQLDSHSYYMIYKSGENQPSRALCASQTGEGGDDEESRA